jgi:hypothetical protein
LPASGPGLTADAKAVVEAMSTRSLESRRDATTTDLLLALATADAPSRSVLAEHGVTPERLAG